MIDDSIAIEQLKKFMEDMNSWETNAYALVHKAIFSGRPQTEIEATKKGVLAELAKIFDTYGISGRTSRERLESPNYEDPPTYNPDTELLKTVKAEANAIVITTEATTGLGGIYRYTLKPNSKTFDIKKREMLRDTGRWQAINF